MECTNGKVADSFFVEFWNNHIGNRRVRLYTLQTGAFLDWMFVCMPTNEHKTLNYHCNVLQWQWTREESTVIDSRCSGNKRSGCEWAASDTEIKTGWEISRNHSGYWKEIKMQFQAFLLRFCHVFVSTKKTQEARTLAQRTAIRYTMCFCSGNTLAWWNGRPPTPSVPSSCVFRVNQTPISSRDFVTLWHTTKNKVPELLI